MKNVCWFKFNPNSDLLPVIISWFLVTGTLYAAFQIFTTKMVAANFITFGFGTILFCGIGFPLVYTKIVKGKSLDLLGISKKNILPSISLGVLLTLVQYSQTLVNVNFPGVLQLTSLTTMVLAVGLFENIFFRGWMQQRLEDAFGIVPSILAASVFYSLYHIGYGMSWSEMYVLLFVGLFYTVVFRLVQNIFILYPFLTPAGALYTNIKEGLVLPFEATYGFLIIIVLSILTIIFFSRIKNSTFINGGF